MLRIIYIEITLKCSNDSSHLWWNWQFCKDLKIGVTPFPSIGLGRRATTTSHKYDRVKCYFYHATGTVRPNLNQDLPRNTVPKRPVPDPTPFMHIRLPPCHHLTPRNLSHHLLNHIMLQPQLKPLISHLVFSDQMKDMKSQMLQMQQMQNFLLKNIMNQAWPPYQPR